MSVGTFQSSVKFTYWDFLLDGFSLFTLSWSARYRRFQTAVPTSSGASGSTPWGSPGGSEGEPEFVEKVGMSESSGGGGETRGLSLYFIYVVLQADSDTLFQFTSPPYPHTLGTHFRLPIDIPLTRVYKFKRMTHFDKTFLSTLGPFSFARACMMVMKSQKNCYIRD